MNKKTVLLVKPLEPSQEAFEKLGFTFKEIDHPLLIETTLPDGWNVTKRYDSAVATTVLYDKKNRIRAHSYQINPGYTHILIGHTGLFCKYEIKSIYHGGLLKKRRYEIAVLENTSIINHNITDPLYAKNIFSGGRTKDMFIYDIDTDMYHTEYLPVKKCVKFMEQNYPDWRNPLAYWD